MFWAFLLAIATMLFGLWVHFVNLWVIAESLTEKLHKPWLKTFIVVFAAVISQTIIAGIFTGSYIWGIEQGIGGFKELSKVTDIFYFSLTTISTLGLGSVEPTQHLRMIAGIESITGFLLISCSAQKVFRAMR